jgi:hypothetical protein
MENVSRSSSSTNVASSSILSIIGGVLMVVGGLLAFSMMGIWTQSGMMPWFGNNMGGMMMGGGGEWGMMMSSSSPSYSMMWGTIGVASAISAGLGAIVIIGGYSIQKKPESASSWGVAILVTSIIGLVSMSGFFIGPILGIIGGILALIKK